VLDHETVPGLRCAVIAGAANNQLADESVADLLAARGILWAPDFVANAGGLINIAEEQRGYDPAAARPRVRQISDTLRRIFGEADAMGTTPLAAAMAIARERLQEGKPQRRSAGRSTPAGSRPSSASLSR
jgi:leucine dehydrogenase